MTVVTVAVAVVVVSGVHVRKNSVVGIVDGMGTTVVAAVVAVGIGVVIPVPVPVPVAIIVVGGGEGAIVVPVVGVLVPVPVPAIVVASTSRSLILLLVARFTSFFFAWLQAMLLWDLALRRSAAAAAASRSLILSAACFASFFSRGYDPCVHGLWLCGG
jgi:hypothetical protein